MPSVPSMQTGLVVPFNTLASGVAAVKNRIPSVVTTTLHLMTKDIPADGLKALVLKPLSFANTALSYFGPAGDFATLKKISKKATSFKAWVSGLEAITKFPKMLEELSKPVTATSDKTRQYAVVLTTEKRTSNKPEKNEEQAKSFFNVVEKGVDVVGKGVKKLGNQVIDTIKNDPKDSSSTTLVEHKLQLVKAPELSMTEAVFSRFSSVANWLIGAADAVSLVHRYYNMPRLQEATPMVYIAAGSYIGAQGAYQEGRHLYSIWSVEKLYSGERYYSILNLAINSGYLLASGIGALGIYFKNRPIAWLGRAQFAAQVFYVVAPIIQKFAKQYMQDTVWSSAK